MPYVGKFCHHGVTETIDFPVEDNDFLVERSNSDVQNSDSFLEHTNPLGKYLDPFGKPIDLLVENVHLCRDDRQVIGRCVCAHPDDDASIVGSVPQGRSEDWLN